ncbi:MAG: hypothetical protein MJ139_02765 [Limosilactobacillus sp.]|nr:hypothetical protein [Limosilactobacillus sp.]
MANFTLNSLSTQSITANDSIMKSSSDGALSKTNMSELKKYVNGGSSIDVGTLYNNLQGIGVSFCAIPSGPQSSSSGLETKLVFEGKINIPVSGLYEVNTLLGLGVQGGGSCNATVKFGDMVVGAPSTNTPTTQVMDQRYLGLKAGDYDVTITIGGTLETSQCLFVPYITSKINAKYC